MRLGTILVWVSSCSIPACSGDDGSGEGTTETSTTSTTSTETTGTTGTADTGTTGPLTGCEALLLREDCVAVEPPELCGWFQVFQPMGACDLGEPIGRCITLEDVSMTCDVHPTCMNFDRVYRRDVGDTVELFHHTGTCGYEPVGWEFCGSGPGCECMC